MIFNEDVVFDGKQENSEIELNELQSTIREIEKPEVEGTPEGILESDEPSFQIVIPVFHGDTDEYEPIEDQSDEASVTVVSLEDATVKAFENPEDFYPTPDASPLAALLAGTIREPKEREVNNVSKFERWKASFHAGTHFIKDAAQRSPRKKRMRTITQDKKPINKARIKRLLARPDGMKKIHQRELPPEPGRHDDLDTHILGEEFRKAERTHLQSHVLMNSWTEIFKKDPEVKDHQILGCINLTQGE